MLVPRIQGITRISPIGTRLLWTYKDIPLQQEHLHTRSLHCFGYTTCVFSVTAANPLPACNISPGKMRQEICESLQQALNVVWKNMPSALREETQLFLLVCSVEFKQNQKFFTHRILWRKPTFSHVCLSASFLTTFRDMLFFTASYRSCIFPFHLKAEPHVGYLLFQQSEKKSDPLSGFAVCVNITLDGSSSISPSFPLTPMQITHSFSFQASIHEMNSHTTPQAANSPKCSWTFLSYGTDTGDYHGISTSLSWFEEQMFFSPGVWFKEALHKHFGRGYCDLIFLLPNCRWRKTDLVAHTEDQ